MTEQARAMAVALRTTLFLVLSPLLQKPLFGAQNGRYRHGWVYSLYTRLLSAFGPSHFVPRPMAPNSSNPLG